MTALDEEDYTTVSQFIELSLSLILKGFDEMEMQNRLKLVNLTGKVLTLWLDQTYGKINSLEQRIKQLEEQQKKKR